MHVNCTPTDSTRNCYQVLGKNSYSYTFGTISKIQEKRSPTREPRAKMKRNNETILNS